MVMPSSNMLRFVPSSEEAAKKQVMVTLRCTLEQRESLKAQAKMVGMSLNQFLLECLFYYNEGENSEENALKPDFSGSLPSKDKSV